MKRWSLVASLGLIGAVAVGSLAAFSTVTACNSGNGTCPDKTAVVPGGACSDDDLQCAFDLMTPAVACDGTNTVIETSCTCAHGTWACPSAVECDAGADQEDATGEAGTEADAADAHD